MKNLEICRRRIWKMQHKRTSNSLAHRNVTVILEAWYFNAFYDWYRDPSMNNSLVPPGHRLIQCDKCWLSLAQNIFSMAVIEHYVLESTWYDRYDRVWYYTNLNSSKEGIVFVISIMKLFVLKKAVFILQQLPYMKISSHDDVIKWKRFPRYWPFVRGIHRSPVNSPHKGQGRGALMFFICSLINCRVNNRKTGDLRRHRAHYDVIVMKQWYKMQIHIYYPSIPSVRKWL